MSGHTKRQELGNRRKIRHAGGRRYAYRLEPAVRFTMRPEPLVLRTLLACAACLLAFPAFAQVKTPPPPASYHVDLRYQIRADRDERIRQFRAMTEGLNALGYAEDPREDADLDIFDPLAERLAGTVPAENARRILDDTRIRTLVLMPAGMQLPDDPNSRVRIGIELRGGLEPTEQLILQRQVVAQLAGLGFIENVGYDHRGFQYIRGTLPGGEVLTLLKDLRDIPGGWFAAETPRDLLPLPLRNVLPIRVVEVLPAVEGAASPLDPPSIVGKLTPDLRLAMENPQVQEQPLRVEVVWADSTDNIIPVRARVREFAAGATLEGINGSLVTVRLIKGSDVNLLVQIPEVYAIRLPRAASSAPLPATADTIAANSLLAITKTDRLHALGYKGAGVRVVLLGEDFPGYEDAIRSGALPKSTKYIDVTIEQVPSLDPAPAGTSTAAINAAKAAALAAPEAQFTLIRVSPSAFHQILSVAKYVVGQESIPAGMQARGIELLNLSRELDQRRDLVIDEYREAFSDLSDEDDAVKRREAAQKAVNQLKQDELNFRERNLRLVSLLEGLNALKGTDVVVNTMVWETGYPNDGLSMVSQYLDAHYVTKPSRNGLDGQRLARVPVWVQAASDAIGSVWAGPFLDADGNGVMEFANLGQKLPAATWSRELNFLGSLGADGQVTRPLPAGKKIRVALQWREPLPLEANRPIPVFMPSIRILRQLDPMGMTAASDEMVEVARSGGNPVPIQYNPRSVVLEYSLDIELPTDGVYAVRIEGSSTAAGTLPILDRTIEIQPRIVVDALDGGKDRIVFDTFATKSAGVGVPADSSAAITIGYALGAGGTQAEGLTGTGPGVTLRAKPDLVVPGPITVQGSTAFGSPVAAGFAGGVAASLIDAGVRPSNLTRTIGLRPTDPLVLPQAWLDAILPAPQARR